MEDPTGDNLINRQANKVELRIFVIYEQNAYSWNDPSETGWKTTPKVRSVSIEYVDQNRVHYHADR